MVGMMGITIREMRALNEGYEIAVVISIGK